MRMAWLLLLGACAPDAQAVFVAGPTTARVEPAESAAPFRPAPRTPPRTCGEATLARAELVALGKGDKHPDVVAVDVVLAQCASTRPTTEECAVVGRERVDLVARGIGPRHPDMIANDAKRAACSTP